jgi:SAM-dependent methyltransferase
MSTRVQDVSAFWDSHPCGSLTVSAPRGSDEFFLEYERYRYGTEPYILALLDLDGIRGQRVVELGCGMGTDGVQFAKAGARYLGIDLTPAGAGLTTGNLQSRHLEGRALVGSGEALPLASDSVDLLYSHGVIHHTPAIERAVAEIWRVLKPNGRLHLMLYHRSSFNYHVSIQVLRRIGALLLLLPGGVQFASRLSGESPANLEIHKGRLRAHGLSYLFGPDWLNRNTDGPENPLARVYSKRTARELLAGFTDFRFQVVNINRRHVPVVGPLMSARMERWLAARYGWHLHIFARKDPRGNPGARG